jgi:hypothetical protein
MAEIKSTLEKVMERVAAMGPVSQEDFSSEEISREGMRLGAGYLRGTEEDLAAALANHPEASRKFYLDGVVQVLLRNIVLPRDDDQQTAEKAMQGLLELGKSSRELITVLGETKEVLARFRQHREQLRQQLESAMRQQLEQALAQQGIQNNLPVTIDPTLHPKFQEEWQRITDQLNEHYGQALEEHKTFAAQLAGSEADGN